MLPAKATESVLVPGGTLKNPPTYWALNVRKVVRETQESRLGTVACEAVVKRCLAYKGRPREVAWAFERRSERVVVLLNRCGQHDRRRGKGPHVIEAREG